MAIDPKLFSQVPDTQIIGSFSRPISGVSIDSRHIDAGDMFVAFKGAQVDGHDFISQAISRGASAVMASTTWVGATSWSMDLPLILVEDPIAALAILAHLHRMRFDIPLIAITGSNGKTTSKNLITHILARQFKVHSTVGNYNNHIGLPVTLLSLNDSHHCAVVEMGASHPGDIAYLCSIAQPTHGLITNISAAHTEFMGDINGVAEVKGELFDHLILSKGHIFVNQDDERVRELTNAYERSTSFGFYTDSDRRFKLDGPDDEGHYTLLLSDDLGVLLPIPGKAIACNAAGAVAVSMLFGITAENIISALGGYQGEPGRMQRLQVGEVTFIHDAYNANPSSFWASLDVFGRMRTQGRKILVFGDMLELGASSVQEHRECASLIQESGIDQVYLVGTETAHTADALEGEGFTTFRHSESRADMISAFVSDSQDGDLVLLKGSRGMGLESFIQALEERL